VTFNGPLGETHGVDEYVAGIRRLAEIVDRVDPHQVITDGDEVCVIYDLVTNTGAGSIPTAGWYSLQDGRITAVRAYFDPRPLVADA
jgi:limonene-1,2-epoxide hydrolase